VSLIRLKLTNPRLSLPGRRYRSAAFIGSRNETVVSDSDISRAKDAKVAKGRAGVRHPLWSWGLQNGPSFRAVTRNPGSWVGRVSLLFLSSAGTSGSVNISAAAILWLHRPTRKPKYTCDSRREYQNDYTV